MAKSHLASPKTPQKSRLLTVREAAPLLGYARQTLFNSFWSGTGELARLPHYKVGRSIRISESDIETFLEARRVEPLAE